MKKQMNRLRLKVSVGLASLALSGGLAYASCGGTEGLVNTATAQLAASVAADIAAAAASIIAQMQIDQERIISAIKVTVKQDAVSSEKVIAAKRSATEGFATAYVAQRTSEQVYDLYNKYRSQGMDPCNTATLTEALKTRETAALQSAAARINTEINAAPGRYGDPVQVAKNDLLQHKQLFCTQAEVNAGTCASVGALPGGDSNAALLFTEADAGDTVSKAKNAMINNIFGLPTSSAGIVGKGATPEAQSAMSDKHRRDSLNSIAMYSFKTIQADHERDSSGKSVAGLLKERVETYFGSSRSEQWAQSLAVQEERGVLLDMVRMEGIALKLAERRVRQNMRIEGNLAGLVAINNEARNGR